MGVIRRIHIHAWLVSVPGFPPWVSSITLDGLSEAVIFQSGAGNTEVLPVTVTHVGRHPGSVNQDYQTLPVNICYNIS